MRERSRRGGETSRCREPSLVSLSRKSDAKERRTTVITNNQLLETRKAQAEQAAREVKDRKVKQTEKHRGLRGQQQAAKKVETKVAKEATKKTQSKQAGSKKK
jgi:hypothetical protein